MKNLAIYGLVGETLQHSFSKNFFKQKIEKESLNADYLNFELKSIFEVDKLLKTPGLRGLNVTIPYKEAIIPFLDELSLEAEEIGAVNTVVLKEGRAVGYNTDTYGFRQMIKPFFKSHHERAIILGTGGASKAVAHVLENLGVEIIYISRNPQEINEFNYEEMNQNMLLFHPLIINTTPVGTFPEIDNCPDIPYNFITPKHLVVDLIYNPGKTLFLEKSESMGATILNGYTMLVQQAERSWKIWNE